MIVTGNEIPSDIRRRFDELDSIMESAVEKAIEENQRLGITVGESSDANPSISTTEVAAEDHSSTEG